MSDTSYYYRVLIYVPSKHQSLLIGEYKIYENAKKCALHFGDIVYVEYFERG